MKNQSWWDPEKVRQDKAIQETRLPKSMGDVKTAMEHIKFMIAEEDPSLFIQKPASPASSSTEQATNSKS